MNEQLLKVLERIELQGKVIWWDTMMVLSWLILLVVTKTILSFFILFFISLILFQIGEYLDKKNVRKKYR